jgi:uncharacterized protein YbjT (DUF2867 family)
VPDPKLSTPDSTLSAGPGRPPAGRGVVLAGASGLVGRALMEGLLADGSVAAVHALARRDLQVQHPKLTQHRVDFKALPPLPPLDEAFIALGTTIKVAGSQGAFRAVDFDAVLAVAKAARAAGATRLGVVSAMGANARSGIFYNRVKGEMEEALSALGFETLVIARPSFLVGDRESLGQPERGGEKIALVASRVLAAVIPDNLKAIDAAAVAGALLEAVPHRAGKHVLLSGEMRKRGSLRR